MTDALGIESSDSRRTPRARMVKNETDCPLDETGLRRGKWTSAESHFAMMMIDLFMAGIMPSISNGTTLRAFLARRLGCAPMRITKKFSHSTTHGIGKCVFKRRTEPTQRQEEELAAADAEFRKSILARASGKREPDERYDHSRPLRKRRRMGSADANHPSETHLDDGEEEEEDDDLDDDDNDDDDRADDYENEIALQQRAAAPALQVAAACGIGHAPPEPSIDTVQFDDAYLTNWLGDDVTGGGGWMGMDGGGGENGAGAEPPSPQCWDISLTGLPVGSAPAAARAASPPTFGKAALAPQLPRARTSSAPCLLSRSASMGSFNLESAARTRTVSAPLTLERLGGYRHASSPALATREVQHEPVQLPAAALARASKPITFARLTQRPSQLNLCGLASGLAARDAELPSQPLLSSCMAWCASTGAKIASAADASSGTDVAADDGAGSNTDAGSTDDEHPSRPESRSDTPGVAFAPPLGYAPALGHSPLLAQRFPTSANVPEGTIYALAAAARAAAAGRGAPGKNGVYHQVYYSLDELLPPGDFNYASSGAPRATTAAAAASAVVAAAAARSAPASASGSSHVLPPPPSAITSVNLTAAAAAAVAAAPPAAAMRELPPRPLRRENVHCLDSPSAYRGIGLAEQSGSLLSTHDNNTYHMARSLSSCALTSA